MCKKTRLLYLLRGILARYLLNKPGLLTYTRSRLRTRLTRHIRIVAIRPAIPIRPHRERLGIGTISCITRAAVLFPGMGSTSVAVTIALLLMVLASVGMTTMGADSEVSEVTGDSAS